MRVGVCVCVLGLRIGERVTLRADEKGLSLSLSLRLSPSLPPILSLSLSLSLHTLSLSLHICICLYREETRVHSLCALNVRVCGYSVFVCECMRMHTKTHVRERTHTHTPHTHKHKIIFMRMNGRTDAHSLTHSITHSLTRTHTHALSHRYKQDLPVGSKRALHSAGTHTNTDTDTNADTDTDTEIHNACSSSGRKLPVTYITSWGGGRGGIPIGVRAGLRRIRASVGEAVCKCHVGWGRGGGGSEAKCPGGGRRENGGGEGGEPQLWEFVGGE